MSKRDDAIELVYTVVNAGDKAFSDEAVIILTEDEQLVEGVVREFVRTREAFRNYLENTRDKVIDDAELAEAIVYWGKPKMKD